ncbi:GNAT family N-acetyltransferase [Pedobacter frigoris]|uniref:GNAT family N-acetyltransferase n=1 Tax=Pedobacter frigoris TaxID=2571272 RepID=A0A4U1CFM7_9SPHI|nr:GNAT family N-acetyltransferase [Pedobacter frigoris]TKC05898.1 GNAT family N-acetyltransferase [Pedobacter frigoris]
MKVFAETDRIILREIVMEDAPAMFEMDSDPEVHRYLGKNPVKTITQVEDYISFIRKQYIDYGIGRWAIVDKATSEFVGWGGLKYRTDTVIGHTGFYEVGYRLLRKFWGRGYATESARASVKYAFEELNLDAVYAMASVENAASRNALLKTGLKITAQLDHEGIPCDWFEITKGDWNKQNSIRQALSGDAPKIAQLIIAAMDDLALQFSGAAEPLGAIPLFQHFAGLRGNQYSYEHVLVYQDKDGVCGMICGYDGADLESLRKPFLDYIRTESGIVLDPESETQKGEYYIDSLSVAPDQQGKGIAKKLIHALIGKARSLGHTNVGLLVNAHNPKAKKLYLNLGFVVVNERKFMGGDYFHMQYRL